MYVCMYVCMYVYIYIYIYIYTYIYTDIYPSWLNRESCNEGEQVQHVLRATSKWYHY